jgi:nucleoside-diphosphate-sugar epimerase
VSTVLVTGATGFVGRHALQALLRSGQEVHAVARTPPPGAAEVSWHTADLLEPGAAERVVAAARPSHLLHLAWYAEHGRYWTAPENVQWVEATLALFRAFAGQVGERAVMAGTSAEYDWSHGFCSEHVTPRRPATLYGVAKDAAHRVVAAAAEQAGVGLAWGRVFFLYGPHEHPERLVPSVARALVQGRPAPVSSGAQVRDFMHVEDVADGFAALLRSNVAGPVNVASGDPVRIRDIVATLGELAGRPDLLRLGELPDRPGDPPLLVADVRRLRDEVGFVPRHSLVDGLRDTLEWWRARL